MLPRIFKAISFSEKKTIRYYICYHNLRDKPMRHTKANANLVLVLTGGLLILIGVSLVERSERRHAK